MTDLLYAEDLPIGFHVELGTVGVSREEIIEFARRYDPLPFHVDPAASHFGDVIGSSIHTLALFASLASPQLVARLAIVAGKGIDRLRLPNPVRPGSTLRGSMEVVDVVAKPDRADIHCRGLLIDQDDLVVLSMTSISVVRSRPPQPGTAVVQHII
ncbi:MaoC/PaaZ C-terminal domain-containing protein [Nocardioides ultimimeridianus]